MKKLFFLFFLFMFIFSCARPVSNIQLPQKLFFTKHEKSFSGILVIENIQVPFYYNPKTDTVDFPLIYTDFVFYSNKTLCLNGFCQKYPLPLWAILKGKLLKSPLKVYKTPRGYEIVENNPRAKIFLTPKFELKKALICGPSGCKTFIYNPKRVETTFYGKRLIFLLRR